MARQRFARAFCLGVACVAALCLAGAVSGWCDVLNSFAPFWALGAAGALFASLRARLRLRYRLLAAFGLAVPLCLVLPDGLAAARDSRRVTPGPAALTLVSFNVWDENVAPERTLAIILTQHADVIGLEEDTGAFAPQESELRRLYPYAVHCGPDSGGCSLWSKRPFLASGVLAPAPYGMALAWGRTTAPDGRPVTAIVVHLAWPLPPRIKRLQMARLVRYLGRFAPQDIVLAGDFNQTPWSFALARLDRRLRPLRRRSHALFSWPAFLEFAGVPAPFPLLPIDQIYTGPAFAKVSVQRLSAGGSDHYGLLVRLERTETGREATQKNR
jgi:endonuclease/exonuclease/phosphatase (EEP) superfamily protein YafD